MNFGKSFRKDISEAEIEIIDLTGEGEPPSKHGANQGGKALSIMESLGSTRQPFSRVENEANCNMAIGENGKSVVESRLKDTVDEIEITSSRTGIRPLQDYAHSRQDCEIFPWHPIDLKTAFKSCPKCFCYACDTVVSECDSWKSHCLATNQGNFWILKREMTLSKRGRKHLQGPK